MIQKILNDYWLSDRQVKTYIACLELWNSIASSIARRISENRITTYSILKELVSRWIINEVQKNWVKHFSAISPEELLKLEEQKINRFKDAMPELMAISNLYNNKAKVHYYDWLDKVKELFFKIVDEWNDLKEPFLTFVWTQKMDYRFEKFLNNEFKDYRLKLETPTKAIISDKNSNYSKYHQDNHNCLVIDDSVFEMWNEIVLYNNKVAVLSYSEDEIFGLIIESRILFNWLKSMFNLIWKAYKR